MRTNDPSTQGVPRANNPVSSSSAAFPATRTVTRPQMRMVTLVDIIGERVVAKISFGMRRSQLEHQAPRLRNVNNYLETVR